MSLPIRLNGLACALALSSLVGCAAPPAPLYSWEGFPRQQYSFLLRDGASPLEQIAAMNAHAEKARARNASLPPGFRAHLGMLHLSVGNSEMARDFWSAEKSAFPESAQYMDSLLKKLDRPAHPMSKENPA